MHDGCGKNFDIRPPSILTENTENTEKNIYLKLDLPSRYTFLCTFYRILPIFNLSVLIFLSWLAWLIQNCFFID